MTADTPEELHQMAERIGMRRSWFEKSRTPHYNLTATKREYAIKAGAVFVEAVAQARGRMSKRKLMKQAILELVGAIE